MVTGFFRTPAKIGMICGAAVAAAVYVLFLFPFTRELLSLLENRLYDVRVNVSSIRGFDEQYRNIVVVKIDDASFEKLDMKWPWNRRVYARAVRALSEAGARVIAFDVFFSETSSRDGDAAQDAVLATAIDESTASVVLAYSRNDRLIPMLTATRAERGFIENVFDADSIVRRSRLVYRNDGVPGEAVDSVSLAGVDHSRDPFVPSWNFMVLKKYLGFDTGSVILTEDRMRVSYTYRQRSAGVITERDRTADFQLQGGRNIFVNFGIGENYIRGISFHDVVRGNFDPEWVRGRIVLIGATVRSLHDDFATPLMQRNSTTTPGVMIHALAQATFLENAFIYEPPMAVNLVIALLMCSVLGAAVSTRPPFKAFMVAIGLSAFHLLASVVLFLAQIFIHASTVQVALLLTYVIMTSYKYLSEEKEKQMIKSIFKQYVTAEVVDEILKSPEKLALGGRKTALTVVFLDIRNFTRMSEQLMPEQVVDLLNSFFEEMVQIVYKYEGTLDKYLGDGMMIIFGAPVERPDSALRAVRCALEMQGVAIEFSRRRRAEGLHSIDGIGIGVNTGDVVVGNIGSQRHKEYTIIGDNVNLAARIVSIALVNQVLVSENTFRALEGRLEARKKETVKLKGKSEPVNVYEIVRVVEEGMAPAVGSPQAPAE